MHTTITAKLTWHPELMLSSVQPVDYTCPAARRPHNRGSYSAIYGALEFFLLAIPSHVWQTLMKRHAKSLCLAASGLNAFDWYGKSSSPNPFPHVQDFCFLSARADFFAIL